MLPITILMTALLATCNQSSLASSNQGAQGDLIYNSDEAPIHLRVAPSRKYIQAINYSDRDIESVSLACIVQTSSQDVVIKKSIKSVDHFDLDHINLSAADRKNSTFSMFTLLATERNVRQCNELGSLLAVVEVKFADKTSWKLPSIDKDIP